jgi:predicted small lipoprotein YifL
MRFRSLAVVAALALASTGCGDDGPRVSEPASAWLAAQVEQIHTSAAANDRAGAEAGLAQLRLQVDQFLASNDLTIAAAGRILAAADDVQAELAAIPTATPAPPPETSATPQIPDDRDRDNNGNNGNDKRDDDDDDDD